MGGNGTVGQQLRSSLIQAYYHHYIDYDRLKDALKTPYAPATARKDGSRPKRRQWNEADERAFEKLLEDELEKVYTFQRVKAGEIVRRIQTSKDEVAEVLGRLEKDGDDDKSDLEQSFLLLEEDLSDVIADVHDLAKFTRLNYTGFYKIIKKHDVGFSHFLVSIW